MEELKAAYRSFMEQHVYPSEAALGARGLCNDGTYQRDEFLSGLSVLRSVGDKLVIDAAAAAPGSCMLPFFERMLSTSLRSIERRASRRDQRMEFAHYRRA